MSEKLTLTEQAEAAYERATKTGKEQDVSAAVRAIYAAGLEALDGREAHKDPVCLAFLIELARRLRVIEERAGLLLPPPKPSNTGPLSGPCGL